MYVLLLRPLLFKELTVTNVMFAFDDYLSSEAIFAYLFIYGALFVSTSELKTLVLLVVNPLLLWLLLAVFAIPEFLFSYADLISGSS